jgi:hypothetical protein
MKSMRLSMATALIMVICGALVSVAAVYGRGRLLEGAVRRADSDVMSHLQDYHGGDFLRAVNYYSDRTSLESIGLYIVQFGGLILAIWGLSKVGERIHDDVQSRSRYRGRWQRRAQQMEQLQRNGTKPYENDSAADWFSNLWDEFAIPSKVEETLKLDLEDNHEEIRAAAYMLLQLGDTYIWPVYSIDRHCDLAARRLEEMRAMELYSGDEFQAEMQKEIEILRSRISKDFKRENG